MVEVLSLYRYNKPKGEMDMKKYILLLAVLLLTACGNTNNNVEENNKEENTEETKLNETVKLDDELTFDDFNIEMKKVKFYEKKGKLLADVHFSWRNKDDMEKALYSTAIMDVEQNSETLSDINDHWNPDGDRGLSNDVFLPNTSQGLSPVKLTYELVDKESPLEITFTQLSDEDNTETITIEIE